MVPTRRVHFLVYTISDLNSLNVFLWSLVEDKVCVPSIHAILNWNDRTRTAAKQQSICCKVSGKESNIVLMCAG